MICGVLNHGGTRIAGWMVDFMENPNIEWMMTGGCWGYRPQFEESSIYNCMCYKVKLSYIYILYDYALNIRAKQ